jgi:hypothetical protein
MRRYLIVANQTLLGDPLLGRVKECLAAGPCQFHVVVPATHAPGRAMHVESRDRSYAASRLQEGLDRFRALGADVEGEVGDTRPMDAIRDVMLHAPPFHEIIVSTLPPGISRWLRQDLPHRVQRTFGLPVSWVAESAAA